VAGFEALMLKIWVEGSTTVPAGPTFVTTNLQLELSSVFKKDKCFLGFFFKYFSNFKISGKIGETSGAITISIMTLSIMILNIMTISIMTFNIMTISIMTISIMTVSIMTSSIKTHSIMFCYTKHK
jgi:hypothetical protein